MAVSDVAAGLLVIAFAPGGDGVVLLGEPGAGSAQGTAVSGRTVYRRAVVLGADVLNVFVVASAAVPAYLLARSVTGSRRAAYGVAAVAAVLPWPLLPSLSLGRAVAYASFVLALLLLYRATAAPGPVNDSLALLAIALAAAARLQLLVLLAALPLAVLLHELGTAPGRGAGTRIGLGLRRAFTRHRVLVAVYAALLVLLGALALAGRAPGELAPPGLIRAFVAHLAEAALSVAVVPFLVAAGWLLATIGRRGDPRRHALASVAAPTIVLVVLAASSIDLRFGHGAVREEYLFYVAPVVAVALACALVPLRRPRWSLLTAVLAWLGLGLVLSRVTTRVVDWFVMTDELLYERLAISIARTDSPLPRLRGEVIDIFNQLYPLVLSRVYETGLVPDSLHDAHVLNAFVMSFAAVPAYLLARSATGRRGLALGVGLLSVSVPWLTLSSFLLSEVVAYPAFVLAVLAIHRSTATAGPGNDVLALLAIALAASARVQFLVLLAVLPLAVLVHEIGSARGSGLRARIRTGLRSALSRHRLLAAAFAALVLLAAALAAGGSLSRVLGVYAQTTESPLPPGLALAAAQHLAAIALSLAILPFLVAAGWLLATIGRREDPRRHACAAVAVVTVVLVTLQVASFNLRFGGAIVRERYLFYVVPVLLVALACALSTPRWPRWSLLWPTVVLGAGFATYGLPRFEKLNVDTPIAVLHDGIVELGGSVRGAQAGLVLATLVLVLLFVQAVQLVPRAAVAAVLAGMVAFALPAGTGYAFSRLFAVSGTSGRPLTLDQGTVFAWIDRHAGPDAEVTMVPYPHLEGDYWATIAFWWDLEFWNKSVVQAAFLDHAFEGTPATFRNVQLAWDDAGALNVSPTPLVAQLAADSRFRISGETVASERETDLIQAGDSWRLDWASSGLYEDGWTKPDTSATVTVFPAPGQSRPLTRLVTLAFRPSGEERPLRLASDLEEVSAVVHGEPVELQVRVCVPPGRPGEVALEVLGSGPIAGNPVSVAAYTLPREGGVAVGRIGLSPEAEPGCPAGG